MCCPSFSWMVVLEWHWTVWTENPFSVAEDVAWLIFSYVGAEIGRQRIIPWSRVKSGIFASSVSRDCLSHIWGGSNLITIEVSNLQGWGLSPVYNALFHSSPDTDIWHQDTSQLSHSSHPLSPVTGAHRYDEHESEKQTSLLTFIWSSGAISEEFRANGTLRCAKKLNTNPVHRTQQW